MKNLSNIEKSKNWNIKIFIATAKTGPNTRNLIMVIAVKNGVDFEQAAIAASKEYCRTANGKKVFEGNCNSFNWVDFDAYVPNSICEKYGIRKIYYNVGAEFSFDQQLVDKSDICD